MKLVLANPNEKARLSLAAVAGCDSVNQEDGSCSDYAYILAFNAGDEKPFAKKRFYLRVSNKADKTKSGSAKP
jgi:hypothetical protein